MKKYIIALLLMALIVGLVTPCFAISTTKSGKTMVGINYLIWGYSTGVATGSAQSIVTGLSTIRGYGLQCYGNSATSSDAFASVVSGGTIAVFRKNITTSDATVRMNWWAIGR